jgi:hypothetical protein
VVGWTDGELDAYRAAWTPLTPVTCGICRRRLVEEAAYAFYLCEKGLRCFVEAFTEWVADHVVPVFTQILTAVQAWLEQSPGVVALLAGWMAANGPIEDDPVPIRREARRRARLDREPWRQRGRPR